MAIADTHVNTTRDGQLLIDRSRGEEACNQPGRSRTGRGRNRCTVGPLMSIGKSGENPRL